MNTIFSRILIFMLPTLTFAAEKGVGIGQFAEDMTEPVTILSNFISSGSFIVGILLLASALMRYMQYRTNPLASPLGTVITLLLLGIMLVCLPFVYILLGAGIPFTLFGNA